MPCPTQQHLPRAYEQYDAFFIGYQEVEVTPSFFLNLAGLIDFPPSLGPFMGYV